MYEQGGDVGGTWYWNRYPGASCDIESYIYFPLLEETGFVPKQKYTNAPETLEYCKVICKKFNLYENACLQTEVTSTIWNEDTKRWLVKTNLNDEIKARYVVHSNGPLNRPKLPAIKGINDYKGHTFHTSRWDYEYTGGNSHGNLDNLKDKRVAIIGTGATAVQCVPHLGEGAKQLYVFQRTPSSIDVRNNQATDPDWISTRKEGWHDERRKNFETLLTGGQVISEDLGIKLENVKLNDLGSAKKVKVDKENSTIVSGSGKKSDIEARCAQIKQQVEETTSCLLYTSDAADE